MSFWHFDIGNLTTWLVIAIGLLVTSWKGSVHFGQQFGEYKESFESLARTVANLADKVSSIDAIGTQFSRLGLARDSELSKSNTARLETHDRVLADLGPKISTAVADLEWIKHYIQKKDAL